MDNILALILAGGRVDDLGVLTFFRPKSVLPFGGLYRVIDFPMTSLMQAGIEKVGIFSQYRPFHLMHHIADGAPWDMVGRNRFAVILPPFKGREASDWYKGTADAVYQNIDFIKRHQPELVVLLSGDHIYRLDYSELIRFHREKKADVTIVFTEVPEKGASRFGLARIDDEDSRGGRVLEYLEKPQKPPFLWASMTIYVFDPKLLIDVLRANARQSSHEFGRDIIPRLLERYSVYGYKHRGYWGYTRTPDEYWQSNMDLLGDSPKIVLDEYKLRTNVAHRGIRDKAPAFVGKEARITDALIYSGCRIEGEVTRSVLFPGAKVGPGSVVRDSILLFETVVDPGSIVERTIADVEVHIGKGCRIGEPSGDLTLIGRGSRIPDRLCAAGGVTVYPNLKPSGFAKKAYVKGEVVQ